MILIEMKLYHRYDRVDVEMFMIFLFENTISIVLVTVSSTYQGYLDGEVEEMMLDDLQFPHLCPSLTSAAISSEVWTMEWQLPYQFNLYLL